MGRRRMPWLLIAIALFTVVGHICALPVHVHAGTVTTHSEDRDAGDDHTGHAGSCEALRTTSIDDIPVLPTASLGSPVLIAVVRAVWAATAPAESSRSAPLFLLHAALLI